MNLKEYLFYKNLTATDLAYKLDMHPSYIHALMRGKTPLTKKFSYTIEIFTKGVVKHTNVFGPPSYPDLENVLRE